MDAIWQPLGCTIVHFYHRSQASLNSDKIFVHIGNQCSRINTRAGVLTPGSYIRQAFNLS